VLDPTYAGENVMPDPVRDEWIKRVLAVDVAELHAPSHRAGDVIKNDAEAIWGRAKHDIAAALAPFSQRLQESGDPLLQRIATDGLPSLGKQQEAALDQALRAYGQASQSRRQDAAMAVRSAVEAYRTALARQTAFRLVDENPFRIKVAMRDRLAGAFAQVERSLNAVEAPTVGAVPVRPTITG
jgi:hypothetical protein